MRTRQLENIKSHTDSTDHLYFKCPDCEVFMNVRNCENKEALVNRITYFFLECPMCRGTGTRKVIWKQYPLPAACRPQE